MFARPARWVRRRGSCGLGRATLLLLRLRLLFWLRLLWLLLSLLLPPVIADLDPLVVSHPRIATVVLIEAVDCFAEAEQLSVVGPLLPLVAVPSRLRFPGAPGRKFGWSPVVPARDATLWL